MNDEVIAKFARAFAARLSGATIPNTMRRESFTTL